MGFASDIRAFKDKALKSASDNTSKVFSDLSALVIRFSPSPSNPGPYAKGLLVNQYYFSVGNPDLSVTSSTSPTGADSLNRLAAFLESSPWLGKDNTAFIANSTQESYYADILGWAAGKGTNGWVWTGKQGPYMMRAQAITYVQQAYT